VDGRFLDISALQEKLDEISASVDEQQQTKHGVPLTIAERLRRDLLTRLRRAWQGRAERADQREDDLTNHVPLCLGLDASHHAISGEADFTPEQTEIQYYRPQETSSGLELTPTGDAWQLEGASSIDHSGQDNTRLSRFGEKVDVWEAVHATEIHARDKREAAMANFSEEPWLCVNQSPGGLALRRLPEATSRTRVGAVVAFRDNEETDNWKVGALVWLRDNPKESFDIGIQTLADRSTPVAVRAIGGAGTGGEYFRSLLLKGTEQDGEVSAQGEVSALLVPASIYDVGTQLVLNQQTTLEYVRLTRMIDTSSSFSMFEFKHIEVPPAEQAKINSISQSKNS
jgi:hypothetical protein